MNKYQKTIGVLGISFLILFSVTSGSFTRVLVPTAVAQTSCALPNYPDASCTGVPAGTVLTVINGGMEINTPNTLIEAKDIRGCVSVSAPGVIIRKSKIACSNSYSVDAIGFTGTWLTIEDSEIHCNNSNGTGIGEENVIIRRSNIHGCENGFDVNKNFLIEDNYIHDLTQTGVDPHTDGIQMWNTATNVTIKHNRIYAFTNGVDGTSAIISPSSGTLGTIIRDNLFAGGAFTLYCRQGGPGGQQIINNHFSTINDPKVGAFGPWTECEDEAVVSGNVYHESGQLLAGQSGGGNPPPPPPPPPDPTPPGVIGESNILPNNDSGNGNTLLAQQATLSVSGTVQSMSFYVVNAAGQLRLGIYDATGPNGGPGTKVAETNAFTPVTGWNTQNLIASATLSAGSYWLAYLPSSSSLSFREQGNGTSRFYGYSFGIMPATFSTSPTSCSCHWSLYATLISGTALLGDINSDHIVNSVDYSILNAHWFTNDSTSDLNHDGLVNAIDYSLLNSNWFKTW